MVITPSIGNIMCKAAYIGIMFLGPLLSAFCAIAGAVYSRPYGWLIAAIIAFLTNYLSAYFSVDLGVNRLWGDGALAISFLLITAFFAYSLFHH
ncbi:hypothetical protein ICL29_004101 [Salmonella enterica]|nr:hypothetical protein [Salmonella enterica]EHK5999377.1 hypothetical protein [Salmonella enterica]EIF5124596.1 hypothetical protein [Salmonella enterica]EIF5348772.1 hypothetical protein [Salmonella enterica]EIF5657369.1 hypothetical protein [Salmonella enterica]